VTADARHHNNVMLLLEGEYMTWLSPQRSQISAAAMKHAVYSPRYSGATGPPLWPPVLTLLHYI